MWKLLSEKESRKLELNSVRIETKFSNNRLFNIFHTKNNPLKITSKIVMWVYHYNLDINNRKKVISKLTQLLENKPYYRIYCNKYAVWGFSTKDGKFIIYNSNRGTSIQVSLDYPKNKIKKLLKEIKTKLILL